MASAGLRSGSAAATPASRPARAAARGAASAIAPARAQAGGGARGRRSSAPATRSPARRGGLSPFAAALGLVVTVGLGAVLATLVQAVAAATGTGPGADALRAGVALVVVALAYAAGGWVAGRTAGGAGALHGLGVWVLAVALSVVLSVLGAAADTEASIAARLGLPRVEAGDDPASGGAIGVGLLAVLGSLAAATLGGRAGARRPTRA